MDALRRSSLRLKEATNVEIAEYIQSQNPTQFLANILLKMKLKSPPIAQDDLFKNCLENMIDTKHKLVKLSELINWQSFDNDLGKLFPSEQGV